MARFQRTWWENKRCAVASGRFRQPWWNSDVKRGRYVVEWWNLAACWGTTGTIDELSLR